MFLNTIDYNYDKDVIPFIKNGIIIDTSVIKIIINGLISTRISRKKVPEFEKLLNFLDLIKVNNQWNKFLITPHILTEVCGHLRNDYNKHNNYKTIIEEVLPLLEDMKEKSVSKDKLIASIDLKNPIIEAGDISIFAVTNDFIKDTKKIAILVKDNQLGKKYKDYQNVMVMDYNSIILNSL